MKLFLNTSDNLKTIVKLDDNNYEFEYKSPRDQNVMGALLDSLENEQKDLTNITEVEVFTGPGSFTGLRVGISIANALSFALNIPINGEKAGTVINPYYGKEPNITKK
ncbi:hypothetical protein ACFL1M_02340 [Patescibacteria group bacterium]